MHRSVPFADITKYPPKLGLQRSDRDPAFKGFFSREPIVDGRRPTSAMVTVIIAVRGGCSCVLLSLEAELTVKVRWARFGASRVLDGRFGKAFSSIEVA